MLRLEWEKEPAWQGCSRQGGQPSPGRAVTMQGTEGRSVKLDQSESNDGESVGRGGRKQLGERGETVHRHHQENLDV